MIITVALIFLAVILLGLCVAIGVISIIVVIDDHRGSRSGAGSRSNHEAIVAEFGDLPPEILVVTVCLHCFNRFLEIRVFNGNLCPKFIGRFQGCFHYLIAERPELSAGRDEAFVRLHMQTSRDVRESLRDRHAGKLEIRMKSDGDRHRFR